eukprot:CAMPEP_0194286498 /NCGR_PEP_ID=MMETSP0169-20130528/32683_1 /TAXON_ID=218684 /ORGANISM="Corethron pennatum, Strain L29A3" /LENGTH=492 /DNA_ID=CAMNT_0039032965 /DNA_START=28 /DNA_END=1506 /DNA_ORIENTATION=-
MKTSPPAPLLGSRRKILSSNLVDAVLFLCAVLSVESVPPGRLPTVPPAAVPLQPSDVSPSPSPRSAPHDTLLYEILRVPSGANIGKIALDRAYRRRSREHHPDKRKKTVTDTARANTAAAALRDVRTAHQILSHTTHRALYDAYGIVGEGDWNFVVRLLSDGADGAAPRGDGGGGAPPSRIEAHVAQGQRSLAYLLGAAGPDAARAGRVRRSVVELIRPYVEGGVGADDFAHHVASICEEVRGAAMGRQVMRMVGRAYRSVGREELRGGGGPAASSLQLPNFFSRDSRRKIVAPWHPPRQPPPGEMLVALLPASNQRITDTVGDAMRGTKYFLSAAAVTGKLIWSEHRVERETKKRMKRDQEERDDADRESSDGGVHDPSDDIFHVGEGNDVASEGTDGMARIRVLQLEALWKVRKIPLDAVIRSACRGVLHAPFSRNEAQFDSTDGWVAECGTTDRPRSVVPVVEGRRRAAEALVMVGELMVRSSKEGVNW